MRLNFQPILSAHIRCTLPGNAGNVVDMQYGSDALDNELFQLSINNDNNNISINVKLQQAICIELLVVQLKVQKQGIVTCLNRNYQHVQVSETVRNNDLTPLHVSYTDGNRQFTLRHHHRMCSHVITDEGSHFALSLYIDAAAAHPKWSYETQKQLPAPLPVLPVGHIYNLSFAICEGVNYPILCRYPNGADAAFVITDHCDFDDTTRLQTFLHDWLGKGLKMTKGVFSLQSPKPDPKYAPTLQDDAYKALIQQLHKDGSEIAPHAFNQSSQISIGQFKAAMQSISQAFAPATWIDHGSYLKYCYYMGAAHNPDYMLLDALRNNGFTAIWSFNDAAMPSHQTLNLFATKTTKHKQVVRKKLMQGELSVALHYIKKHFERNSSANSGIVKLGKLATTIKHFLYDKRKLRFKTYTTFLKHIVFSFKNVPEYTLPYTDDELKHIAPVLFPEHGAPLHQYKDGDLLLFNTQEVVQLDEAYTPQAINTLKADHGLHIGHTYLLNKLPYVKGVFNQDNSLAKYWTNFTAYLSAEVKHGNVWNPTMAECTQHVIGLQHITITYPSTDTLRIHNSSYETVKGISFKLPSSDAVNVHAHNALITSKITVEGRVVFWLDVPAHTTINITW